MRVAVLKEDPAVEPRVGGDAGIGEKLIAAGRDGRRGGRRRRRPPACRDEAYRDAGAEIADERGRRRFADADLVIKVRRPDDLSGYKRGAAMVALMDPYGNEAALRRMADAGLARLLA